MFAQECNTTLYKLKTLHCESLKCKRRGLQFRIIPALLTVRRQLRSTKCTSVRAWARIIGTSTAVRYTISGGSTLTSPAAMTTPLVGSSRTRNLTLTFLSTFKTALEGAKIPCSFKKTLSSRSSMCKIIFIAMVMRGETSGPSLDTKLF